MLYSFCGAFFWQFILFIKYQQNNNYYSLSYSNITTKGATALLNGLRDSGLVISRIKLSGNHLEDGCMPALGEFIQKSQKLEVIRVDYNNLTNVGIQTISKYLTGNTMIRTLDFKGNRGITDESGNAFKELSKKSYITEINLGDTNYSEDNQKQLWYLYSLPLEKREIPIQNIKFVLSKCNKLPEKVKEMLQKGYDDGLPGKKLNLRNM